MKTLCFLNNKGGVGKTASVTTIGHILATEYNKKVLLVDMDPQHNTSARFSSYDWIDIFMAVYENRDLNEEKASVSDVLMKTNFDPREAVIKTKYDNLDIIPAYLTLSTCENLLKADVTMPQQFRLKNQLSKIKDEYDYCLIDCSPSISILNINALAAADEVYIPVRTDGDSCIGLAISLNLVKNIQNYNPQLRIGGVFLTQCTWQEGVAKATYQLLKQILPKDMLIPIQIGNNKFFKEVSYEQQTLLEADKNRKNMVTKAYIMLSEYIMAANKASFLEENADRIGELKSLECE